MKAWVIALSSLFAAGCQYTSYLGWEELVHRERGYRAKLVGDGPRAARERWDAENAQATARLRATMWSGPFMTDVRLE
jgi:hypothetical protein